MKRKTAKQKAWEAFSKHIRKRDALRTTGGEEYARCITCGNTFHIKEMDAGHWMPRNKTGTFLDEHNCHAQCRGCNRFGGGRPAEYANAIVELYGEDELITLTSLSVKVVGKVDWSYWRTVYEEGPEGVNQWREYVESLVGP